MMRKGKNQKGKNAYENSFKKLKKKFKKCTENLLGTYNNPRSTIQDQNDKNRQILNLMLKY